MNRLFIAAEIPEDALNKLIEIRDNIYNDPRIKWEPKEKLHITLKFLGDVEEEKNKKLIETIANVLKDKAKFDLFFEKFGFFKKAGQPRILWVKTNDSEQLKIIQHEIDNCCNELGFPKENREFKPHVTLLRIRGNEDIQKIYKFSNHIFPKITFTVSNIILFKSELKSTGSVYHKIKNFNLH
ncbi:RNA 2',3'-cyclic phosphodiesterase [Melioribacteraceae bacterium 4301-Me]|uniref:RNA 2',3'-cyclic phosphodiesterase n=1 Tax=Pyranulibacter aquaticus TaxID=3163344 RepID=UPI00359808B6